LFGLKLLFNFGIFKPTRTRKPRVFFGKLWLFLAENSTIKYTAVSQWQQ